MASAGIDLTNKSLIVGHHFAPVPQGEVISSQGCTRTRVAICVFTALGILAVVGMLIAMGNPLAERDIFPVLQIIAPISFCVAGILWLIDSDKDDYAPGGAATKKVEFRLEDLEKYLLPKQYIYVEGGYVIKCPNGVLDNCGKERGSPEVKDDTIEVTFKELYDQMCAQKEQAVTQAAAHKEKVKSLD